MENELQQLLGRQYLITAFIEPRLQIVNYIKNGYDDNVPLLMNNRFLHFTAHNYYRGIIVDLGSLFINSDRTHKSNFFRILTKPECKILLAPDFICDMSDWLSEVEEDITIIERLRNKEIAHFDLDEKESISMNFNNLLIINTLFDLAKKIITNAGSSVIDKKQTMAYHFDGNSTYLTSLKRLVDCRSSQPKVKHASRCKFSGFAL